MSNQVTPRQYAKQHGTPYSTVLTWIKTGKLPAKKTKTSHGVFYSINQSAPRPATKRGPKSKGKS